MELGNRLTKKVVKSSLFDVLSGRTVGNNLEIAEMGKGSRARLGFSLIFSVIPIK